MLPDLAYRCLHDSAGASTSSPALTGYEMAAEIDTTAAIIARRLEGQYTTLLLTGAAARGEQTTDPLGRLASDLDFLVVLPDLHSARVLLAERRCRQLLQGYETQISASLKGLVSIGFLGSSPRVWQLATPFMYELRTNARCLYGDPSILGWPRISGPTWIPAWEGVRLVANRLCEMFGALARYHRGRSVRSPGEPDPLLTLRYSAVKQILACSEAALIFAGKYRPSYRARSAYHECVSYLFSPGQNAVIAAAYSAKLGRSEVIFTSDPDELALEAARLALHTLSLFRAGNPFGIVRATRLSASTAPGPATDLLFFMSQTLRGRRVPVRRAISSVYSQAVALALHMVAGCSPCPGPGGAPCPRLLQDAAELYGRYAITPQVVGVI